MRVAITGGTGMIGSWLADDLRARGDDVLVLTRGRPTGPDQAQWDPGRGLSEPGRLEGVDAVVHLNGAPIADRPWTRNRRKVLWDSRIGATETLLAAIERLDDPPRVFVSAGGLGYFGDRGDDVLDEAEPRGSGFLAELAEAWEQSTLGASRLGCRAAVLRMSIVLSPTGGAFPLMVKPFRIGVGGWLGNGKQYTSWISVRDASAAFRHLLDHPCEGAYNGTIPEPTRNKEWCKALGAVLHRPVVTHAPKWALRGAFGELADDLLLASVRAVPGKLLAEGFTFQDGDAEATYRWLLDELGRRRAQARPARAARQAPRGMRVPTKSET